jgi:hypothetical protein
VTAAAAIVADVRRAIELLAERNDPAGTRIATALDRWISGEGFDQAFGLPTDWRQRLRFATRDAALRALEAMHPNLDAQSLAERIVEGIDRVSRSDSARPDGESGYLHDLAVIDAHLSTRHWRRLVTDLRGHQEACNGHDKSAPCVKTGELEPL